MATGLQRTFGTPTNNKIFTLSLWLKRAVKNTDTTITLFTGGGVSRPTSEIVLNSEAIALSQFNGASYDYNVRAYYKARDISGWYHIVYIYDSTQSTASDRVKFYMNGVLQNFNMQNTDYPTLNFVPAMNGTTNHAIGGSVFGAFGGYAECIMSHIHFTDGTAYAPTVFGSTDSTTGEWEINIDPSVTYGNNGFWILKNGNSVTDQSGQGNNWTVGAGTLTKTEDSPSNVFATWNPLQATTAATYDFVSGNTRIGANDVAQFSLGATLAATTGKYYMEMVWAEHGGYDRWGMMPIDASVSNTPHITGIAWDESAANLYMLGNVVSGSWGANMSTSDIIQIALDLDNGAFYLGVNGTWRNSGDPTSGASRTGAANFSATSLFGEDLTFAVGKGNAGTSSWNANFGNGYFETVPVSSAGTNASGNGIFEYDVPTGYTALSTKGLNS